MPDGSGLGQNRELIDSIAAIEKRLSALEAEVRALRQTDDAVEIDRAPDSETEAAPEPDFVAIAEARLPTAAPAPPPVPPPLPRAPRIAAPERSRSMEAAIGENWASWIGGAVLLLGICFFLKYAWDRGWIQLSPQVRVVLAIALGVLVSGIGEYVWRRGMRRLATTLHGTGLAIVIVALFGANRYFDPPVLSRLSVYIGVVATAAAGIALALRTSALLLAVLSFVGVYLAPAILSTGEDKSFELLLYLGAVSAAGWVISHLTAWRESYPVTFDVLPDTAGEALVGSWLPLRWFIFVATVLWFVMWWTSLGRRFDHRHLGTAWAIIFYAGLLTEIFATLQRATRRAERGEDNDDPPVAIEWIDASAAMLSLLNTAAVFGGLWMMWGGRNAQLVGMLCIGLAAVQAAVAYLTASRQLMWSALLQAAGLVTIAVPLILDEFSITIAWLGLAIGVAALGWLSNLRAARGWAVALLALALLRVILVDSDQAWLRARFAILGEQEISRWLLLAWGTAVVFHVIGWLKPQAGRWPQVESWIARGIARKKIWAEPAYAPSRSDAASDDGPPVLEYAPPDSHRPDDVGEVDGLGATLAVGGTALFLVASEVYWSGPWMTILAIAWLAGIVLLAPHGKQLGYGWHALWLVLLISARWLLIDGVVPIYRAWEKPALDMRLPVFNAIVLAGLLCAGGIFAAARNLRDYGIDALRWIGLLLFAIVNFEAMRTIDWIASQTPGALDNPPMTKQMTLSVLWALSGFVAVVVGFRRRNQELRYAALALLGITLAKILLVDMAGVKAIWRILSFVAVGTLLLCVSFVYHKQTPNLTEGDAAGGG